MFDATMMGWMADMCFHCLTWYYLGSAIYCDFFKAAADNDEFVLDDEDIICNGVGVFGYKLIICFRIATKFPLPLFQNIIAQPQSNPFS